MDLYTFNGSKRAGTTFRLSQSIQNHGKYTLRNDAFRKLSPSNAISMSEWFKNGRDLKQEFKNHFFKGLTNNDMKLGAELPTINTTEFNDDISAWDVSNVTDMSSMFEGAKKFNQNLSYWEQNKTGINTQTQDSMPGQYHNNKKEKSKV